MQDTSSTDRFDRLRKALRAGVHVHDRDFDAVYSFSVRAVSRTFWTPVRVAQRAAELLVRDVRSRVLDVGAGAGKFCIVGALKTGARFTGLEHRRHLVTIAGDAAERLGVTPTTHFLHGGLREVDWRRFSAFYFFNPFSENLYGRRDRLDDTVELSKERFRRDVDLVYGELERAPPGTRVVTYHGFGRELPPCYRSELREGAGSDVLELWVRTTERVRRRDRGGDREGETRSPTTPPGPSDGAPSGIFVVP
jgi:predicted RNA methylase